MITDFDVPETVRPVRKAPILGGVHRPTCRCSDCQLARGNRWYHYSSVTGRDDAIEAMHDDYDRHPGKRRIPSRDWCEVYRVVEREGSFILYVRKKSRGRENGEGNWEAARKD